jgi:leucyl aminopeptidase
MSSVLFLIPIITEDWAELNRISKITADRLGYRLEKVIPIAVKPTEPRYRQLELEVKNSSIVADGLEEEEQIQFTKGKITITFKKDERRRLSVCVAGVTKTEEELRELGTQFAQGLVQQYVYQKIKKELQHRKFVVAEEETTPQNVIRLKVRHW